MHLKTAVSRMAFKHFSQIKEYFGMIVSIAGKLDKNENSEIDNDLANLKESLVPLRIS
jgi:hypothetical protein